MMAVDCPDMRQPQVDNEPKTDFKDETNGTGLELEAKSDDKTDESGQQEVIFVQESPMLIYVHVPGYEHALELQVNSMEVCQELYQLLMDREETCNRTCFSLQINDVDGQPQVLDHFSELKTYPTFKNGAHLKLVEEPYTLREARLHVRHVRELLRCLDPLETFNGTDGASPSYLNIITQGDLLERRSKGPEVTSGVDCTPPAHVLPEATDIPLSFLHVPHTPPPAAIKTFTMSQWNPPPGYRKLRGDLLYLYVTTLEGKSYHITACSRGFFVGESTNEEFKPAAASAVYHSLIDLLNQLSPLFKKNFSNIQKKRLRMNPFERVPTPYPVYTWMSPMREQIIDSVAADDAFSFKLGYEDNIPGQTRDWNEELQSARELPRGTLVERLNRERAIFKIHSDFVSAAIRGTMAVIDGNVMALNPGDSARMQMFLWNNIFFSLGFDVKDHFKELGGDVAAYVSPLCDLHGVRAFAHIDCEGVCTLGTVVLDYRGYRITAQSVIPGILERDNEQAVQYGSIDFGKTVIANETFQELLKKPAEALKIMPHSVINSKNESVELYSSVDCKGIIGNDGRRYVLDLLRTFPADLNFLPGAVDVESISEEARKFGFPRAINHRLSRLRHELCDSFVESRYVMFMKLAAFHLHKMNADGTTNSEAEEKTPNDEVDEKRRQIVKKAAEGVSSLSSTEFDIRFNPDLFSPGVNHAPSETLEKEKKLIIEATNFIIEHQIPLVIQLCEQHNVTPMDGQNLTDALHSKGINVRYLGVFTTMIADNEKLQYLHTIAVSELITRACKHIYTQYIQSAEALSLAAAVSHFLNCLLSGSSNNISAVLPDVRMGDNWAASGRRTITGRKGKRRQNSSNNPSNGSNQNTPQTLEWTTLTPKSLWQLLKTDIETYYGFSIHGESFDNCFQHYGIKRRCLLRAICLRLGIQVALKDYPLDGPSCIFTEDDILNLYPVAKHIHPKASDAYTFYAAGQTKVQQASLREGFELLTETLHLMNTVYGAMHPEIAQCLRLLARLSYVLGDYRDALSYQQKATIMSERVNGIDHQHTITEYTHLALYCFANSQVATTLKVLYRARYLTLIICDGDHPDVALLDSNIGLVLHAVGQYDLSVKFLNNALRLTSKFYGPKSLKAAVSYHLLARALSCAGDFRSALVNERETYAIYKQIFGEDHDKTKESSHCLRLLTQQAVVLQKHINNCIYKAAPNNNTVQNGSKGKGKEIKAQNTPSTLPPIQVQMSSMGDVLDMLNVINGIIYLQFNPQEIEKLHSEMQQRTKDASLVEEKELEVE